MATSTTQNGGDAGGGGAIVHIRADSDSTLEDLFDVVHKPQGSKRPLQVPLRMRNLPESFFRQPNFGSKSPNHSRENSTDLRENCSRSPGPPPPPPPPLPPPVHSRAHSSPASLQQTLAVAQQQQQQQQQSSGPHIRQASYDVSSSSSSSTAADMGPLPPGWEIAKTPQGQIYFMNHLMKTTQWEDPRKQIHQLMLQQQMSAAAAAAAANGSSSPRSSSSGSMSPVHSRSNSATTFGDPNGPLPHGWDQSETPEGEMYFINHATKKTTWFDPRIPIHHQRVPIRQAENAAQKRQQDMRLARLENERRAIQQRQAEIKRSMQSMRQHQEAMQQTQELLMRHNINESAVSNGVSSSMDPFLSSSNAASNNEIHNRQESADSGLGMGSNFNLGSIPEDMTGMEMDTDLDATLTTPAPAAAPSNQTSSNSTTGAAVATGDMDSDSLIPSLTSDIEDISPDLMHDVHSLLGGAAGSVKQVDNLTWL